MKTFVNLLPFEDRRRGLVRRRLIQWSMVWAGCLAIGLGAWWLKREHCLAVFQASDAAERAYLPVAKLIRESDVMRAELRELQAQDTVLGQLLDERPLVTLIGMTSRSARQCNGRLVLSQLLFERKDEGKHPEASRLQPQTQDKSRKQVAGGEGRPWASVSFTGKALDNVAVATFAAALRDSGLFRRVELKSSVRNGTGHTDVRSFLLECEI